MKLWECMTDNNITITGPLRPVYKTCDDRWHDDRTGYHYRCKSDGNALEHMMYVEFKDDYPRKHVGKQRDEISDGVLREYEDM